MKKTKTKLSISISSKLNNYVEQLISNRSKYIEYLIYQDLKKSDINIDDVIL